MPLADLDDAAELRAIPADPPLDAAAAAAVAQALDKLFRQFAREDRVTAWAVEPAASGSVLLIACQGAVPLSGCSRDKVDKVLVAHEQHTGRRLLSAPPMVIEVAGAARCVDRAGLRALAAAGAAGAASPVFDCRVATLGEWRARGRTTAGASWMAALLPPAGAAR